MIKSYKIPSEGVTENWVVENLENRYSFQVYKGIIEHINDWETFKWAKGKTIKDVIEWMEQKENKRIEDLKAFRQRRMTKDQQDQLHYEEYKKKLAVEMERYFGDTPCEMPINPYQNDNT